MIKLFSSLNNRVFLASALVAILSIGFALRFVTTRATRGAEAELRRGLEEAAALVTQSYASRIEGLTLTARLVADLPKLKAAVETGDPPTVAPVAADYQARVKADVFAVTNRRGDPLAVLGAIAAREVEPGAVQRALSGNEGSSFQQGASGVLQVVTVPISIGAEPPEVLGTLSLGLALNDALAAKLKAVTESEVAFALDGRVLASSMLRTDTEALAPALAAHGASTVTLGGNEYVALVSPLAPSGESRAPVAVVLRSRTERLRFLDTLRAALAVAAGVAVLGAVLLSYAVARTVTRPLADVTAAMREVAETGDLTRKISPGRAWDDEDARVLASAFNTLTDSIARFQRQAGLKQRLSALGRLSTVIAHEVRNPLMIIKASLRALQREGASKSEIAEAAADIDHEVARLNRIVGDVLDFARPVKLACGPTDLNALCREAAAASRAGEEQPGLTLQLAPELGSVVTDAERLRTALLNVLGNAREAVRARSETDGSHAEIVLRTLALRPDRAAILVQDQGIGIAPGDLPHVFDPYFTTKRTGTGLGLAIAKNIVDSLGGLIDATSAEGRGTEIRIELPTGGPPAAAVQGRA